MAISLGENYSHEALREIGICPVGSFVTSYASEVNIPSEVVSALDGVDGKDCLERVADLSALVRLLSTERSHFGKKTQIVAVMPAPRTGEKATAHLLTIDERDWDSTSGVRLGENIALPRGWKALRGEHNALVSLEIEGVETVSDRVLRISLMPPKPGKPSEFIEGAEFWVLPDEKLSKEWVINVIEPEPEITVLEPEPQITFVESEPLQSFHPEEIMSTVQVFTGENSEVSSAGLFPERIIYKGKLYGLHDGEYTLMTSQDGKTIINIDGLLKKNDEGYLLNVEPLNRLLVLKIPEGARKFVEAGGFSQQQIREALFNNSNVVMVMLSRIFEKYGLTARPKERDVTILAAGWAGKDLLRMVNEGLNEKKEG